MANASLSSVIKNMPDTYNQVLFSELNPFCEFRNKFILGTIVQAYPIVHGLRNTHLRKFLLTDALSQEIESSKRKLSVFLFDNFAKECETAKEGDILGLSDFLVENLTLASQDHELMPIQVCLNSNDCEPINSEDRQIWIIRKTPVSHIENSLKKKNSSSPLKKMTKKATNQIGPVEESPTRSYCYSTLNELSSSTTGDQYFNTYGIVVDCHLRTHSGSHSQSLELQLSDSTRSEFCCIIYCKKDDGPFPDVHVGDVVRIHRLMASTVRGKLKGKCISHKFIVIFEKDNQDLQPKTTARTFVYTDDDKQKVKALFHWAKLKNAPKLICNLQQSEDISLIVQVIGVYIAKRVDCVTLKIWDGTRNENCENKHLNLDQEKIAPSLFDVAKPYYINLFVYGNYCLAAGQLEPGQYIHIKYAHLTSSPNPETTQFRLIIPALQKAGRGVFLLSDEDSRVQDLKRRLNHLTEEVILETEKQSSNENGESFFLNCDISTSASSQINNAIEVHPHPSSVHQPPLPNNGNPVVSVLNAAVCLGQSTQEFGGIYRETSNQQASKKQKIASTVDGNVSSPKNEESAESLSKSTEVPQTTILQLPQPLTSEAVNQLQVVPPTTNHKLFGTSEICYQQFAYSWAIIQVQPDVLRSENETQLTVPGIVSRAQPDVLRSENETQLIVPGIESWAQSDVQEAEIQAQLAPEAKRQAQLVSEAERQAQLVPEAERQAQLVPEAERQVQLVPEAERQAQLVPEAERQVQLVPEAECQVQLIPRAENATQVGAQRTESQAQFAVPEIGTQLQFIITETAKQAELPIAGAANRPHSSTSKAVNESKHIEFKSALPVSQLQTQEISISLENTQNSWWKCVSDSLSVTDGHSHVKPSSLSEVVDFPTPYKFRVVAVALHFKPETESINKLIRVYCSSCHYISKDATPNLEVSHLNNNLPIFYCPECRKTRCNEGKLLEYTFLISFNLHDGTGPELYEAFLWQENAVKFFKGLLPEDALRNSKVANSILEMLWEACPNSRPLGTGGNPKWKFYPTLDCCVMSYTAGGLTRYQIFDTILI